MLLVAVQVVCAVASFVAGYCLATSHHLRRRSRAYRELAQLWQLAEQQDERREAAPWN